MSACMQSLCKPATQRMPRATHSTALLSGQPGALQLQGRHRQLRSRLQTSRSQAISIRVSAKSGSDPHLQLATARLPSNVNVEEFKRGLYQWASSLTSSGRNMPFSLPIKTTHTKDGFEMSLLRIFDGEAKSVGDIFVTVEEEPQKGSILFARFFEGDASFAERTGNIPTDPMKRVQAASSGLVDVPIIMQTMQDAIKRSVVRAR